MCYARRSSSTSSSIFRYFLFEIFISLNEKGCVKIYFKFKEGYDPTALDKLTEKFGFPVGCCTLVDEVGIDVSNHIATDLIKAFGNRFSGGDASILKDFVHAGFLG